MSKNDAKDTLAVIPWYWRDWRASKARAVLIAKPVAALAYRELLDAMWGEPDGALPDDDSVLASLAGVSLSAWGKVRDLVLLFLPLGPDGKRHHPRVDHEITKAIEYREACRQGGLSTSRKRWGGYSRATGALPPAKRTPSPSPSPSPNSPPTPPDGGATASPPRTGTRRRDLEARLDAGEALRPCADDCGQPAEAGGVLCRYHAALVRGGAARSERLP